jgi:predicted dehydrogenase
MTTAPRALRFGLVGTGHWARITHAPALASTAGIEFAAVWGRDPQAARALAAGYQAIPQHDIDEFLAGVDAVAFSVPPDVQNAIAIRAAQAGKHLLLEKPVATSAAAADRLVQAVDAARVASIVFFTAQFRADVRTWLADITNPGGWAGGCAAWLGSSLAASSPFNTPWRQEKGALWDVGPHAVSMLQACLGPVVAVTADAGLADVAHLILHHAGGVTSTVTVSQSVPAAAAGGFDLILWGEAGRSALPAGPVQPAGPLRVALTELAANARSGQLTHPCDVHHGRSVTHVLAQAQDQIQARPRPA